jgi:excisionase family DNA binding protein
MVREVEPFLVPVKDAARLLGLGRSTIYTLLNAKRIPRVRIGRRSLVPVAALKQFAEALHLSKEEERR